MKSGQGFQVEVCKVKIFCGTCVPIICVQRLPKEFAVQISMHMNFLQGLGKKLYYNLIGQNLWYKIS